MTSIIRFQNVTKRFGALTVLDDFNFDVRPGEKVTLIGPS
ncbi:MAG: ehuA, partial [Microvirga sp.]|nr:ehuA [Microvirga sp.]